LDVEVFAGDVHKLWIDTPEISGICASLDLIGQIVSDVRCAADAPQPNVGMRDAVVNIILDDRASHATVQLRSIIVKVHKRVVDASLTSILINAALVRVVPIWINKHREAPPSA